MSAASNVATYLRDMGCTVWITGSNQRSRIARGFPDLLVLHEKLGGVIAMEVKAQGDRPREAQRQRKAEWEAAGGLWVFGYLDEARALLKAAGII
jgi:hypothetical protein